MDLKEIEKIKIQLEVVASFKNLNSKITLNGKQCKMLINYIKDLENKE